MQDQLESEHWQGADPWTEPDSYQDVKVLLKRIRLRRRAVEVKSRRPEQAGSGKLCLDVFFHLPGCFSSKNSELSEKVMVNRMGNIQANANATKVDALTPQQAYEIGIEAYCYFYPLILMDITRRQATNLEAGKRPAFGPCNSFSHMRAYPGADFKAVVRPNFDTLYSIAWLDLNKEPVVITVPDTGGRYYLLPMLDMWSDVFASPGWRTSGTGAMNFAVVPPAWTAQLPPDLVRIEAPTNSAWVVGRIKTNGSDDYEAVHELQDRLAITPLSYWGKQAPPPAVTIDKSVDMITPPLETINSMAPEAYFSKAAELLSLTRPHLSDWSILARIKHAGIEAGRSFDAERLEPAIKSEFFRGAKDALKLMKEKTNSLGKIANGWVILNDTMGVYGNSYFKRAIIAMVGLGANQPEDAIYPLNIADADGEVLLGEKKYLLHFDKDQLPPVNAFWSLTMYDADGFQVANPINRFAISSWMPLKTNADASLDLYIQHENPGKDKESNWLPAPASGKLGVTMRLYAPQSSILNGDWVPPVIKKATV